MTDLAVSYSVRLDTGQYTAALQSAGGLYQAFGARVVSASDQAAAAVERNATSMQDAAVKVRGTGDAAQTAAKKLSELSARLDATATSEQQLATAQLTLNSAQSSGVISQERSVAALAQATQRYGAHTQAVEKHVMSERAMSAALRGVPAQFTDIFTSLAAGQPPMQVMLQQGGQLKDMFGGLGPATRALSGYVLGLINPYTVAAAAVVALGVAYYQGTKETENYNRALILSGNIAGTTSGQMADMARSMAQGSYIQSKAAEAISIMAQSGAVGRDQLKKFSAAAIDWEKATGQSIEKTADNFKEFEKAPLAATLKFNESMRYLTVTTYEQIKSLEEHGRKTDAARLAMSTYADAMSKSSKQITENLSYLETSWRAMGTMASWAWNQVVGIGRAQTGSEQLAALKKQLDDRVSRGPLNSSPGVAQSFEKGNQALKDQIQLLERLNDEQGKSAQRQAESLKLTEKKIEWNKQADQFESNGEKRRKEIAKATVEGQALIAAGLLTEKELRTQIANIGEKYKDNTTGQSEVAGIKAKILAEKSYIEILRTRGVLAESLTEGEKLVLTIQQNLKTNITGLARAEKERALVQAKELADTEKIRVAEEKRVKGLKESNNTLDKQVEATGKSADAIEQQAIGQEAANAVQGKSKTAIEQSTLALLKHQLAEADSSDSFDPRYVAALNAKVTAQERYVAALQSADFKEIMKREADWLKQAQDRSALYQEEMQLSGRTALERAKIVAQREIELKLAKELTSIDQSTLSAAEKDAARAAARQAAAADAAAASAKITQDTFTKAADQINSDLTDAILKAGKDGGTGLRQFIQAELQKPFRVILQAAMTPISNAITSAITGISSVGGVSSGAGSIGSMLGNAASLGGLFASSGAYGAAIGTTSIGAGSQAAMLAAQTGEFGLAGVAATAEAAGSTLAGGFVSALNAIPVWGWVLGGIAMLASSLDHSGTPHMGAGATYSAAAGLQTGADNYTRANYGMGDTAEFSASASSMVSGYAKTFASMLDTTAVAFGKTAGYTAATAFADDTYKDGAWGALKISLQGATVTDWAATQSSKWAPKTFADGETGVKEYQAALALSLRETLESIGLPTWAKNMLDALGEAPTLEQLGNTVTLINQSSAALKTMGERLVGFGSLSDTAVTQLINASGGIESLTTGASAFYDAFYSDGEKVHNTAQSLSRSLTAVGATLPALEYNADGLVTNGTAARTAWRQQIEYLQSIANTEPAAAAALATMYGASSAFASITPATTAATAAVEATSETLSTTLRDALDSLRNPVRTVSDIAKSIVDMESAGANLQVDLLRAQGNTAGANAAQKTIDTQGFSAVETALYDTNAALRITIAETTRFTASMTSLRATLAASDTSLLDARAAYAQATGDSVTAENLQRQAVDARRTVAIDGMTAEEVALYDLNVARQGEITAVQSATAEVTRIANSMYSLRATLAASDTSLLEARAAYAQATGDSVTAENLQRQAVDARRTVAIDGMTAEEVALYDLNVARQGEITAVQSATAEVTRIANSMSSMQATLAESDTSLLEARAAYAQATGDNATAENLQRQAVDARRKVAITGMTAEEIALYDLNVARQGEITAVQSAAQAITAGQASYTAWWDGVATADEKKTAALARVTDALGPGINTMAAYRAEVARLVDQYGIGSTEVKRATDVLSDFTVAFPAVAAVVEASTETVSEALARLRAQTRTADQVANNILTLEEQLWQAQHVGDTAALRQHEIESLSATEAALKDQIWAIDDQRAANEAAATAAQAAADEQQRLAEATAQASAAVASQRAGIQRQIWQLTGDTASIRAADLAEIDQSNRALQEYYWSLLDQQSAADAATAAAEKLSSAWASITDSITTEVRRLRGLVAEESGQSVALLQARFATTTAQARAGDQTAYGELAGLSQSLVQAYEASATSLFDLQRMQAMTAASLETTAQVVTGSAMLAPTGSGYVTAITGNGQSTSSQATTADTTAKALATLDANQQVQASAMADLQMQLLRIIKQWDINGMPETRVAA